MPQGRGCWGGDVVEVDVCVRGGEASGRAPSQRQRREGIEVKNSRREIREGAAFGM